MQTFLFINNASQKKELVNLTSLVRVTFVWLCLFYGDFMNMLSIYIVVQGMVCSCCSGPKDHIFVNFVDHGAPGLIAFPSDEVGLLSLYAHSRPVSSNRQHYEIDDCLEDNREDYSNYHYVNYICTCI